MNRRFEAGEAYLELLGKIVGAWELYGAALIAGVKGVPQYVSTQTEVARLADAGFVPTPSQAKFIRGSDPVIKGFPNVDPNVHPTKSGFVAQVRLQAGMEYYRDKLDVVSNSTKVLVKYTMRTLALAPQVAIAIFQGNKEKS